jgi:hypothetical protein
VGAQVLSYLGDQIAQVAIAVLVYAKTGSPLITALGAGWLATDWIRHRAAFAGLAAGPAARRQGTERDSQRTAPGSKTALGKAGRRGDV